ncbi:MAG: DUF3795 domain-containing protein [Pseudomonadota bacterium]
MEYAEILDCLAPCGLSCRKCFAFVRGDISLHSRKLKDLFGNFDIYAERFSSFLPEFKDYPPFEKMLSFFAAPDCTGCRQGKCKYPNCGVVKCYKSKGVDFCFQCHEFPCNRTNFDPHLVERWIRMNTRMKEIGVEAYFEETRELCRYL